MTGIIGIIAVICFFKFNPRVAGISLLVTAVLGFSIGLTSFGWNSAGLITGLTTTFSMWFLLNLIVMVAALLEKLRRKVFNIQK